MDEPDGAPDLRVTVRGVAYDTHAGAVIERDREPPVYVADLGYWPVEMRGRAVEATGVLRARDGGPEPAVSDIGLPIHGARDAGLLELADAEWHAVDP